MRAQLDLDRPVFGSVKVISGTVGNGKNTLAVALARVMGQICVHGVPLRYKDTGKPMFCQLCYDHGISEEQRRVKVYANFPIWLEEDKDLQFAKCTFMRDPQEFIDIQPSKQHMLWIIDEPNAWGFDSRTPRASTNLLIGQKMQQCRHYNADTLEITQAWSFVDLRGKRLATNSIFATTPSYEYFRYGQFIGDVVIPLYLKRSYAKQKLFPYFSTTKIIGQEEDLPNPDVLPENYNPLAHEQEFQPDSIYEKRRHDAAVDIFECLYLKNEPWGNVQLKMQYKGWSAGDAYKMVKGVRDFPNVFRDLYLKFAKSHPEKFEILANNLIKQKAMISERPKVSIQNNGEITI